MLPFLADPLSISMSWSSPAAIAGRSSPFAGLLSDTAPSPLPATPIAPSPRPRSIAPSPPPIPAIPPHNAKLPPSPPSAQQLLPKSFISQTPAPPHSFPLFRLIFPSPQLHPPRKFLPPGLAVLGNSHLTQQPVHPQPVHPPPGPLQIFRITAPPIRRQFLSLPQQLRPHWIQMHVITHRPQIAVAAPVHDQRLVPAAEQMAKQLVPPVESSGISPQKPLHPRHQIGLGRFHHQVKVIGHQAIRMHLPIRLHAA